MTNIDLLQKQMEILQQQLAAMKGQAPVATPVAKNYEGYLHGGPEALFGRCGLEREVCSLLVQGESFISKIPVRRTNVLQPIQAYMTGFNPSGNDYNYTDCGECVDAPTVGSPDTVFKTRMFGCYGFKTERLNIRKTATQMNRGEFLDNQFANNPLTGMFARSPLFRGFGRNIQNYLSNDLIFRINNLFQEAYNVMSSHLWDGSGTNNQLAGLENLISVGQVDMEGNPCPALDSCVCDVDGACLNTTQGAAAIFAALQDAYRKIRNQSRRQAFGNVRWVLVMRTEVFESLARQWPCMYYTQGACNSGLGTSVNVEGSALQNLTDDMIRNRYVIIDGIRIEVCLDDFIPAEYPDPEDAGTNLSDIYFIPMTVNGNRRVLELEVFDFRNSLATVSGAQGFDDCFWTDNGYYLWTPECDRGCICYQIEIKPRLHLKTPQLAAKIANVCVSQAKPYAPVRFDDANYTP